MKVVSFNMTQDLYLGLRNGPTKHGFSIFGIQAAQKQKTQEKLGNLKLENCLLCEIETSLTMFSNRGKSISSIRYSVSGFFCN